MNWFNGSINFIGWVLSFAYTFINWFNAKALACHKLFKSISGILVSKLTNFTFVIILVGNDNQYLSFLSHVQIITRWLGIGANHAFCPFQLIRWPLTYPQFLYFLFGFKNVKCWKVRTISVFHRNHLQIVNNRQHELIWFHQTFIFLIALLVVDHW